MLVKKTDGACGARIEGIDLSQELSKEQVDAIRSAWLEHHVLAFPNQQLSDDDLERFSQHFGSFAGDPYFPPIEGRQYVAELRRTADETTPIFADAWHSDWSFRADPPAGTILYGLKIPPVGGNTDFINLHKALNDMPAELRQRLEGKIAQHSAKLAYAPDGLYGEREKDAKRGMKILYSEDAYHVENHPIIRKHPESGKEGLFGTIFGYIVGIEDTTPEEEQKLMEDLYNWQTRAEFQYSHPWEEGMLVMWDNRSVLHKANGGYEGHERVLHRVVVN